MRQRNNTGTNDARAQENVPHLGFREWIRVLPSILIEPHPLVQELRQSLEAKDAALADREREITRLQVALAFGLKELPFGPDRSDGTPAD